MTGAAPLRSPRLPKVHPAAFHGLLGEIVRELAPTTEADPIALLVSLMAAVGAVIGDGPHVLVGGSKHPARIWPLLVGGTGRGRKGTAWAEAENVVTAFNAYFVESNIRSGLSTGEGIIHALRDDKDDVTTKDKRLLVVESEFARTLGASRREGNTLSAVLRSLWETGRAAVLTRGDPLSTTGAHLIVVAHVTERELRLKLSDSDVAGGLVNRFLPVLVERSQLLPHEVEPANLGPLTALLGRAVTEAERMGRLRRTPAADREWTGCYAALNDDTDDGPIGEVLARGPAYVLRMALIFALIDGNPAIDVEHLHAALSVWHYVAASARQMFGDLSGSSDLDRLADFLAAAPKGRTRTEVRDLFGRNKSAGQLDQLIGELESAGDATTETERHGPGRPVVRTLYTGVPRDALTALLETYALNDLTPELDEARSA